MGRRREPRIAEVLQVRVRGVDRNGNPFVQDAHTIDISRRGARLDWVSCLKGAGETIEVQCGRQKARFRVAWIGQIGTPEHDQIGILSLEPGRYIWAVPLPPPRADNYRLPRSEAAKAEEVPSVSFPAPGTGMELSAEKKGKGKGRRSVRVELQVPVAVRWATLEGAPQEKEARTLVVNQHGCLLPLKAAMIEGLTLELVNRSSKEVRRGKVIWCGGVNPEGHHQVGIELEKPDPQFWGAEYLRAVRLRTLSDTWVG